MSLASFRKQLGLSQEDCAAALGLRGKGYLSALETGAAPMPLRLALRIEQWSDGTVPAESLLNPEDAALLAAHRALASSSRRPEVAA